MGISPQRPHPYTSGRLDSTCESAQSRFRGCLGQRRHPAPPPPLGPHPPPPPLGKCAICLVRPWGGVGFFGRGGRSRGARAVVRMSRAAAPRLRGCLELRRGQRKIASAMCGSVRGSYAPSETVVLYKFAEDVSGEMLVLESWGTSRSGASWQNSGDVSGEMLLFTCHVAQWVSNRGGGLGRGSQGAGRGRCSHWPKYLPATP